MYRFDKVEIIGCPFALLRYIRGVCQTGRDREKSILFRFKIFRAG